MKLILTGFVVVQDNIKPSQARFVPFKTWGFIFSCTTQNRLECAYSKQLYKSPMLDILECSFCSLCVLESCTNCVGFFENGYFTQICSITIYSRYFYHSRTSIARSPKGILLVNVRFEISGVIPVLKGNHSYFYFHIIKQLFHY